MSHVGAHLGIQARSLFDRLFPDRQIIHRSGGAVRGLRLSPGKQALAALGAVGAAGWCVYASATLLLAGPHPAVVVNFESERANYQRWIDEFRGRAAAAGALLDHETRRFERSQRELNMRHATLRALLEYAHGSRLQPPRLEPVTLAALADEEAQAEAQGVSARLTALRARFRSVLGPSEAAAATNVSLAPISPPDFVASLRDAAVAARVELVAARVDAMRLP